jgi:Cu(I)/Ag(I) efflux system membrane fusion protein
MKVGDKLEFTLQAVPGKTFPGIISFINPVLDPATRTAKVRVEIPNPAMLLKPEMYANATLKSTIKQFNNEIVVPKSAVLWTGKRSIVYVKQPDTQTPAFMLREIELGPSLGDAYVVMSGLMDGEDIVTNGAFTIDASAQLEGKRSMMNDEVGRLVTGHEGHNMAGISDVQAETSQSTTAGREHAGHDMSAMQEIPEAKSEHAMITVQGLCEMCKDRIEKAAKAVNGVTLASYDIENKELHLNFDRTKTSVDDISQAVAKAGHDTDKYEADDATYKALPGCCKYRK